MESSLNRLGGDLQQLSGLRLGHSLNSHQAESLPLVFRKAVDGIQYTARGGLRLEPLLSGRGTSSSGSRL